MRRSETGSEGFKSEMGRSAGRLPCCAPHQRSETATRTTSYQSFVTQKTELQDLEEQISEEGHSACWYTRFWGLLTCLPLVGLCVCWLNPRLNRWTPLYNLGRRQERLKERKVRWANLGNEAWNTHHKPWGSTSAPYAKDTWCKAILLWRAETEY